MADLSTLISLHIKFLYVGSDVCLRFPSDSISRWTPLPSAVAFPLLGRPGDLHPLEYVRAGRTKKKKDLNGLSLWCPEQKRFNYFLLSPIVYNCVSCHRLYIQMTQQNPVKRRKGGQKVAKESESNIILIWHNSHLFSLSPYTQSIHLL